MALKSYTYKKGAMRRRVYRIHQTPLLNPEDRVLDLYPPIPCSGLQGSASFSSVNSSIFKNIHISPEALQQKLPTYSKKDETNLAVKSAITEKSHINNIRGRRRKIPFHEVVDSAKDFLKKREESKKKKKAFILNDLQALQAALPTLEEKGQKKDKKPRASKSFAQQNTEMMEDLQAYHQCLSRPDFEADPFSAVTSILTQHILKS